MLKILLEETAKDTDGKDSVDKSSLGMRTPDSDAFK